MATKKVHQHLPESVEFVERPKPPAPTAIKPPREPEVPIEVEYPSEDGNPMASNSHQGRAMVDLEYVLRDYFEQRPPAFVGIDLIVYYVKDKPQYSVAPDVFVALGVDGGHRDTYKIWEERKVPDFRYGDGVYVDRS